MSQYKKIYEFDQAQILLYNFCFCVPFINPVQHVFSFLDDQHLEVSLMCFYLRG